MQRAGRGGEDVITNQCSWRREEGEGEREGEEGEKREGGREGGREGRREGEREGGREGRREGGRERRKEGRREGGRERGKEGKRERGRERGREERREGRREGRRGSYLHKYGEEHQHSDSCEHATSQLPLAGMLVRGGVLQGLLV